MELAVGAHWVNEGVAQGIEVFYWREGNHEVDFVIRKGNKSLAIEVKSGRKRPLLSGLSEFTRRYPSSKTLVVGRSELPLRTFLEAPIRRWLE